MLIFSVKTRCCVCLGEFELKEELLQIPYCKHVFHISCICNWLQSNSTCPLCRCCITPSTKFLNTPSPIVSDSPQQGGISGSSSHIMSMPQQQEDQVGNSTNTTIFQGNGVLLTWSYSGIQRKDSTCPHELRILWI